MLRRALALLACSTLLATAAAARDTIRLVDGTTIANVQVVSEGLKEVAYKDGKGDKSLPSDTVLSVDFEKKPAELLEVEGLLLTEDLEGAVDTLDAYLRTVAEKPGTARSFPWAPAFAAWRAVELRLGAADLEGVKTAAASVIAKHADTRYLPLAYLAKAEAELRTAQAGQAKQTLEGLVGVVSSQALAKRWELEARLSLVQAEERQKQDARRAEYEKIQGDAGGMPAVQARAQLLVGESFLAEAASNAAGAKDLRAKARTALEKTIAAPGATRATLAAAHAGLGEALFLLGADVADKDLLQQAALSCLRAVTLYRDQGVSVAKALYYAMRCFDLQQDARRKAEMRRELVALYPTTTWAAEARK